MLPHAGCPSDWAAAVSEARQLKHELLAILGTPVALAARCATHGSANTGLAGLPSNVVGMGYGARQTNAGIGGEMALRVYVKVKLPRAHLTPSERIPTSINGTPTDVIAVGTIGALVRPIPCGVSCGHPEISAGTMGCLVRRTGAEDTRRYILSANHVLANSNDAAAGDPVFEPGPADGGTSPIARLTDFQPIDYEGSNRIDAAIAEVIVPGDVLPEIAVIGPVRPPPMEPAVGRRVRKHGRTTFHTVGIVVDLAADIRVQYANGVAGFEDQVGIGEVEGPFALGGDSGSLVVDAETSRPVALVFAGGTSTVFANPIDAVLARFAAEIV